MAWIDHEDDRWEPRKRGLERGLTTGDVIYWLATIIAALMLIFVVADLAISWAQGQPILRLFALMTALLIWLIGRVCRSLF
jgi:hypothetical protein